MRPEDIKQCYYVPGRPGIIDPIHPVTGRGVYSGESLAEVHVRYPGAAIGDIDAVHAESVSYFRSPPEEISEEWFHVMAENLPPERWERGDDCEAFVLSEHSYGNTTAICCRIGERYFELHDDADRPLDAIVSACRRLLL